MSQLGTSRDASTSPDPFVVDAEARGDTTPTQESKPHEGSATSAELNHTSNANAVEEHDKKDKDEVSGDGGASSWGGQDMPRAYSPPRATTSTPPQPMDETRAQTSAIHSSDSANAQVPDLGLDPIGIVDAQKTSDGVGQSPYIAYLIRCGTLSSKRRYSEFASLREALVALHPTVIVPPIPSKHSLTDYAARQSKAKEDATIIARRKRMLQVFLNRVKDHPRLGSDVVFRRFLDGRWSWHEITSSPPLSTLPKSNLRAPASDPASSHASPAYLALPLPPANSTTQLKNPNQRFLDSEAFTERFRNHIQSSLEKTNRRVVKRWGESASDYAELGAVLNGFSLSESGLLANAIERTGQAADSTFMAIGSMLQEWETLFTEPLNEYSQFGSILQKLLRWRHLKHLQFELAQDALEAKKLQLEELERIETEASRLNSALESGGRGLVQGSESIGSSGAQGRDGVWDSVNSRGSTMRRSVYGSAAEPDASSAATHNKRESISDTGSPSTAATATLAGSSDKLADSEEWTDPSLSNSLNSASRPTSPPTATNGGSAFSGPQSRLNHSTNRPSGLSGAVNAGRSSLQTRRTAGSGGGAGSHQSAGSSGGGILGALSSTFHSVMDVDPETTRRNTISRLKDNCAQLEEALELTENDLRFATLSIQADLDRFQRQKVKDLREMALNFAKVHREFCRINLQSWKEAKDEVAKVTENNNGMPESSLARHNKKEGRS
ncbi:hypothetical protein CBS101457_002481 [Exobasidium rhododendri]|nr:hypothetical protein CBS101457_002481 [Exobasidium rhododendri]